MSLLYCFFPSAFSFLSQCIHEFPLVFIFGIATSPMIIHKLLPHSVSSLLCIELFQSLSCKDHLSTVIDKVRETTLSFLGLICSCWLLPLQRWQSTGGQGGGCCWVWMDRRDIQAFQWWSLAQMTDFSFTLLFGKSFNFIFIEWMPVIKAVRF